MRTANVAEKTVSENFIINIQHRRMIQSKMPTRWSFKSNQSAYVSSDRDFEKQFFFFFKSQLCTPLPTNNIHFLVRGSWFEGDMRTAKDSWTKSGLAPRDQLIGLIMCTVRVEDCHWAKET